MTITDPKFRIGGIVFHVTSDEPGVVLGYVLLGDHMLYRVAWSACNVEDHAPHELVTSRPDWDSSFKGGDE